ncbi:DUF5082 family protein [Eubacterium sp. 1001713B170207_170306_E7]|uniref:YwqH-like family protein n=1 Tax=Eubacterium sp. 1001713B170207_170306_E7 TaxID=2787097 RepID=UPI0018979C0B|nr:DUF5082 family protein [Eubacterium sp. 1001713B170207_170306_E7]
MSLESLQNSLYSKQSEISAERANLSNYQAKIAEIDAIYQTLKGQKKSMKELKKDVKSFGEQSYPYWQGNVFKTKYQEKLDSQIIEGGYEAVIGEIDTNLDALNTAKTEYENKVLASQGLIGVLAAGINSLINAIENFVN